MPAAIESQPPMYLPPEEYWRIDPDLDKIKTLVDSRGLVVATSYPNPTTSQGRASATVDSCRLKTAAE